MKPKYVYSVMLNLSPNHIHFYLDYDEAMKDIKEHKLESFTISTLKPGTEFCTDFDTDGDTYIRNLVELDDGSYSIDFFIRNPIAEDPDIIGWFRAIYTKKPEKNYQVLSMFSIIVNGHNVMHAVVNSIASLPVKCFDMNPEDLLRRYIREYIHFNFRVADWIEK